MSRVRPSCLITNSGTKHELKFDNQDHGCDSPQEIDQSLKEGLESVLVQKGRSADLFTLRNPTLLAFPGKVSPSPPAHPSKRERNRTSSGPGGALGEPGKPSEDPPVLNRELTVTTCDRPSQRD